MKGSKLIWDIQEPFQPFSLLCVKPGSLLHQVSQAEIPLMFRQFFGLLQNACEYGVIIGHKM